MFGRMAVAMSLAVAFIVGTPAAKAAVADFNDLNPFFCQQTPLTDGGLTFSTGFFMCVYGPTNWADWPNHDDTSTLMGNGYSTLTVTKSDNAPFELSSLDLELGVFNHQSSDTTTITGNIHGGGTESQVLTITNTLQTFSFNWGNLDSFTLSELTVGQGYLGIDNVVYNTAAPAPEPASLALLGAGLAGLRVARRRKKA